MARSLQEIAAQVAGYNGNMMEERESLIIDLACGATAKTARLFGSHDETVPTENAANGISISPQGVSHEYLRSWLKSKSIHVSAIDVSASSASQIEKGWKLVGRTFNGEESSKNVKLRTTSGQNIDTKAEMDVNWLIDGDKEIEIPMEANAKLSIRFHYVEVAG